MQRYELYVYRAADADLIEPIATLPLKVGNVANSEWDGKLPAKYPFRQGDELVYVLRAYDAQGNFDETFPNRFQLVKPEEFERGARLLRDSSQTVVASALGTLAATDTTGLAAELRRLKGERGRRDVLAQSWLGAVMAGGFQSMVDDVLDYTLPGYSRWTRSQAYMALESIGRTTPAVRAAIVRGLGDDSGIVRLSAADAARAHLDDTLAALVKVRAGLPAEKSAAIDALLGTPPGTGRAN